MRIRALVVTIAVAACLALPAVSTAQTTYAVWLDGETGDPTGGGSGIVTSLTHAFGASSFQLVSTANLETTGFLNSFKTVIISRNDSAFGTQPSALALANIKAYVGTGAGQGGVALFTNDLSDNLYGATTGDVYDANLDKLFINAVTFCAATGHGYMGEFNGTVAAFSINLLPGTASATYGTNASGGHFIFDVGPIGAGNPIDAGVTFPFTDLDSSLFRTDITGASPSNIVDAYDDNGLPAVLANRIVIQGGALAVPALHTWELVLLAMLLAASAYWMARKLAATR